MDWASASVTQAGFSTSTCLPAAAAARTCGAWDPDEQISTGVNVRGHKVVDIGETRVLGNVEVVADLAQQFSRDIANAADDKAVAPVAQVRQVLNLGNRAAADDTHSQTGHGPCSSPCDVAQPRTDAA